MKKSLEQINREFNEIMAICGLRATNRTDYSGNTLYFRRWKCGTSTEGNAGDQHEYMILASCQNGIPTIWVYQDGRRIDLREYCSPKRAINGIKDIIRRAGYKF